jgi:GlpG protein
MRRIGTLPNEHDAAVFRDYLLTLGIRAQVDAAGDAWVVWIHDEDRLDQARHELGAFQAAPRDARYAAAVQEAERRREAELKEQLAARKRHINLRDRWQRPLVSRMPITLLLIGICIVIGLLTQLGRKIERGDLAYQFYISQWKLPREGSPFGYLPEVRAGQVWRLITPIFLHSGALHLGFNMYVLFLLGGSIEGVKGWLRYLLIVLWIAAVSNVAQYLWAGPAFGGMSGVGFGLFGYLWMKSRYAPEEGFFMPQEVVFQFLLWMGLCIFGFIGRIANTAHVVGMIAGMLIALAPVLRRRWTR